MDTYDIPFDGIEDHVAELLEEMDGSSVVINKGNELEVLYDRWLFVNPDSTGGDFAGFTMQVCKVFFCPFCGKDLTVKPEEVSAQMSLGLPAEL